MSYCYYYDYFAYGKTEAEKVKLILFTLQISPCFPANLYSIHPHLYINLSRLGFRELCPSKAKSQLTSVSYSPAHLTHLWCTTLVQACVIQRQGHHDLATSLCSTGI